MELTLKGLSKKYGQNCALQEVDLTFNNGIYGLLGPNGAGKSTLLNVLAGNLPATSGQIIVDGTPVKATDKKYRKRIGYMPQVQTLYPDYTVEEFLLYIASLRGVKKTKAKSQINRCLELVLLWDMRKKKIHTLSGGMKQRVLLAQAIIADPDILILDEPTAGLDPMQRIQFRKMIQSVGKEKIVIIATHVVQDVEYAAKEIILLNKGEVIRKGTPSELIQYTNKMLCDKQLMDGMISDLEKVYLYHFEA